MAVSKRKQARQEKRAQKQESKQKAKSQKKQQRLDARQKRIETRQKGKTDRTNKRQDERSERASGRQETRQTAYENGINPNDFIADIVESGANMTSNIVGLSTGKAFIPSKTDFPIDQENLPFGQPVNNEDYPLFEGNNSSPFQFIFDNPVLALVLAFLGLKFILPMFTRKKSRY